MERKETKLFEQEYDVGEKIVFSLYRSQEGGQVTMSLRYCFPGQGIQETTCKRLFFPVCAEEFRSPYLSWYNLICCSNNYGPIPVVSYMNCAVQNGKKIAATIYPDSAAEYMRILSEVGEDYYCYPYHPREYRYMLYISRKGKLSDYFELERLLEVYRASGVSLDAEKMEFYFQQELSWFGNEELCPIRLHDCVGAEELAVTGLLFGYPVESTVALIGKSIDMCEG